jgi:hypothetical protein
MRVAFVYSGGRERRGSDGPSDLGGSKEDAKRQNYA